MHEWALAEAVIKALKEFMSRHGIAKVRSVRIGVGMLQGVDLEIFDFALSELKKEASLEEVKFQVSLEDAKMKCWACGHEWEYSQAAQNIDPGVREAIHFVPEVVHAFIRCPQCGSPDFEVVTGRGVRIRDIVLGE